MITSSPEPDTHGTTTEVACKEVWAALRRQQRVFAA
jgi:hypothetical protein